VAELVLTQVYLEPQQKKLLAERAKALGKKPSEAIREAIDAFNAGVTVEQLQQIDAATKAAKMDLDEIAAVMDAGRARDKKFFAAIARIKAAAK
jgi:Ribbon-helix-helix protein, copG family